MRKISGANMDIDFEKIPGMDWEPGSCPLGEGHKCAEKGVSICPNFKGIEYPDVVLCNYEKVNGNN